QVDPKGLHGRPSSSRDGSRVTPAHVCDGEFLAEATLGEAYAVAKRPELERCLAGIQPGDALVVWKLDRLARSLRDLLTNLERLHAAGAGIRSLTEPIDTA